MKQVLAAITRRLTLTAAYIDTSIRVGYWKSPEQPDLPMPKASPKSWSGEAEFLLRLTKLEKSLRKKRYRGFSSCRICGKSNGDGEFEGLGFMWPDGLRHYVAVHHVKPPANFVKLVSRYGQAKTDDEIEKLYLQGEILGVRHTLKNNVSKSKKGILERKLRDLKEELKQL